MMSNKIPAVIMILLSACSDSRSKDNLSIYSSQDKGGFIIALHKNRAYIGDAAFIENFIREPSTGYPIKFSTERGLHCVQIANLVFSDVKNGQGTCKGYSFRSINAEKGRKTIIATCDKLHSDGCYADGSQSTNISYSYTYDQSLGVTEIKFGDLSDESQIAIRHSEGRDYILRP